MLCLALCLLSCCFLGSNEFFLNSIPEQLYGECLYAGLMAGAQFLYFACAILLRSVSVSVLTPTQRCETFF